MYGSDGGRRALYPTRRVYVCTECHKSFRNTVDLYQHVEMCLLEAFENEALSIFNDTPLQQVSSSKRQESAASFGITAKPSGLPPMEGRVEVRLGMPIAEKEPLQQQQPVYVSAAAAAAAKGYEEDPDDPDGGAAGAAGPSSRMIEGPGGLRLVVTVEKEDGRDDEEEEEDDKDHGMGMVDHGDHLGGGGQEYMEDDLTIQEEEEEMNAPLVTYPRRQVIGALANADDEPYKPKMECPTCGLVLYRHNFATHFRIHTGELPFPCSYCERRFRSTSALKVHTRAHTGEKPYECPTCDYAALTKRNLDRHILNNHVREGERRGPRSRKSKYRVDPDEAAGGWTLEALEKAVNRPAYDARKDHQYEGMEELDEGDVMEPIYADAEDDEEMGRHR